MKFMRVHQRQFRPPRSHPVAYFAKGWRSLQTTRSNQLQRPTYSTHNINNHYDSPKSVSEETP